jgi:ATP-dependent Lhr-like helicase
MLGEKLGRLRGDVGVHHGSLPREERERVEQAFKKGELKALVCTSTLELGIDIGSVDLAVQYMSPRQVTSLIQRVGRSGHSIERPSKGVLVSVSADDVLESVASVLEAGDGRLEATKPYINSLDVLAHQIAGYLMDLESIDAKQLLEEMKKTHPYRTLNEETFWRVVKFLEELRKIRVDNGTLLRNRATREYYFENTSTIPDETRYLVVDVVTNQTVGILGEEFVLLRAKVGLHFILKGKIWQIEKIADDRRIYVTSIEDPLAAIPGWDGEMLPVPFGLAQRTGRLRRRVSELLEANEPEKVVETLTSELPATQSAIGRVVEEIREHKEMGAPIPSDDLILVEGFQKYLIVHSCFGEAVNRVFGYVLEELLSRKGLIRLWWMDGYRILVELTEEANDLDSHTLTQLFTLSPEELERTYAIAVQRNFPFPNRVKIVAERFGALKRGKYISHPNLCSLPTRFENTPIYEEALQETGRDLIDMQEAKETIQKVREGEIKLEVFRSTEKPTPIAYHILYRYLEVPELVAPDSLAKTTLQKMKMSIYGTVVDLVCLKCGKATKPATIGELPEEISCESCKSGLLSPIFWTSQSIETLVRKKIDRLELNEEEKKEIAKIRRAADLVLSYGKRAIIAQSVYGIGPQTAARILAEMHEDEEEFYKSLLEAKLKFISTRPFW